MDPLDSVSRVERREHGVEAVCKGANVEESSNRDTSDTVNTREVPRKLGLVDCELGRDGAVLALRVENLDLLQRGDGLGLDGTAAEDGARGAGGEPGCAEGGSWC